MAVIIPMVAYIVLSTPWAQKKIQSVAQTELSNLLGTPVEIGRIDYKPFNTLSVSSIAVRDQSGGKALAIGRLSARFELFYFLRTKRLLFDYAVIDAPEVNIWRASPGSPINIQPILDKFKKKDNQQPPVAFDLEIGTVILRKGIVSYNVLSEPFDSAKFCPNHIRLSDLDLHAFLRHVSNDDLDISLEGFSFREQSGFELTNLVADFSVGEKGTSLSNFELEFPTSRISLSPVHIDADKFADIPLVARRDGISIETSEPAVISTVDFSPFAPVLARLDFTSRVEFDAFAREGEISLKRFAAVTADGIKADFTAAFLSEAANRPRQISLDINQIDLPFGALSRVISHFSPKTRLGQRVSDILLKGSVNSKGDDIDARLFLALDKGVVSTDLSGSFAKDFKSGKFSGIFDIDDLPLGNILSQNKLGLLTARIDGNFSFSGKDFDADSKIEILSAMVNNHLFKNVEIDANWDSAREGSLSMVCEDPDLNFTLNAGYQGADLHRADINLELNSFSPSGINLPSWRENFKISGNLEASLSGSSPNYLEGSVTLSKIKLSDSSGHLDISRFKVDIEREAYHGSRNQPDLITLSSDFLNGTVEGEVNPTALPGLFKNFAYHILPSLFPEVDSSSEDLENSFVADLTLDRVAPLCDYLRLPVTIIYPVDILATVRSDEGYAGVNIDVPYLKQGDKIIDSTVISAYVNTTDDRLAVYATTHTPTKKGPMTLVMGISGADSRFDTRVDWEIERSIPLNGLIDFSTSFARSESGNVCIDAHFNPGQINFGEDVWNIHPSQIEWCDNAVAVADFRLTADDQEIVIDGHGSSLPEDIIDISLKDINLISIFETLEIENAMIGGLANGNFKASQVLSKVPVITTDDLHVDSISYNHCVVGTADVTAKWDNDKQSVFLDADIHNPEGQLSRIFGDIFVASQSLDLTFDANHVRVGFMQPFMAAFSSEVSGYGSGHAHLFGTFHDIDMEGDIFADDLKLKIDFTNTVYSATDSVHIVPGKIELKDITIRDVNGHTALLNGVLTHEFFHLPRFNFQLTKAVDFLCYNIPESMNPDWYGTIYGNGSASIVGEPGIINIGANMSTAPGSVFTFVLSDRLEAEQYSFITFNDVTELTVEEKLSEEDTPDEVKEYLDRISASQDDRPSDYNLDFRVDITPEAQMILVMDPVGGDRIRANGSGDMRLTYNSSENDIRMYGTYTLDRGSYNFTLQDIIIKDFTIDAGSSISFRGDPYSAILDIEAAYQVNANLTDLDESFALDKDLNRTNVPVQALLKVNGDMRQPDLSFDLRFPTLTSDTYRKVRSIISTEDMMNRQIIYLLALSRFYTPDYMESTTRGNELFSVASSTLTSQLSNMLGKLSDKWSIAPNLRSDRGDFSDVEVDVALSSRLLNNRLLLNGNLGYRDKSLNTNQFIGDFDIEYLLTPKGNWRLKGYSRYNDQNFYVRTAPTTQGVGIMFRKDFDFLFPRKKKKQTLLSPTPDQQ